MKIAVGLLCIAGAGSGLLAQTPAFEVATIKAFAPGQGGGRGRGGGGGTVIKGDRLDLAAVALSDLLPYAFRVKDYQVAAPAWTRQSFWAISAKLPSGASPEQAPDMMQSLLVDRFKLTVHMEKRERPVYTLTAAEGGAKLQKASPDDVPVWDGSFPGFNFRRPFQSGAITGRISPGPNCARRFEFAPLSMAVLADALTLFLGRPVVDQTGMDGTYKVTLDIPPEAEAGMMQNMMAGRGMPPATPGAGGRVGPGGDGPRPPGNLSSPGCPETFSLLADGVGAPDGAFIKAVQALGLKMQQGKAPIDTVVVDHMETKPTGN